MFYKSSGQSRTLTRPTYAPETHDHDSPVEAASPLEAALLEARQRAEQRATAKLSPFEKELLQAWSQDY